MGWTVYNSDGKILQSAELGDNAVTSAKIADGAIVNADINASAVIAYSKLAALADGNILVGNGSNVAVSVNPSGDVDIANDGTFSIATGAVVNADVNSSAAVAYSKLAALTDGNILVGNGSNVATSVNPSGDVNVVNDGTFSISTGVIVNADVNTSAAIALTKLATTTASRLLVSDGSGVITPSSVTTTNLTDLTDSGATTLHSHAGGGPTKASQTAILAGTPGDTYIPPDLLLHSPGASSGWVSYRAQDTNAVKEKHNVASVSDLASAGHQEVFWLIDFAAATYAFAIGMSASTGYGFIDATTNPLAGSVHWVTLNQSNDGADDLYTCLIAYGELL